MRLVFHPGAPKCATTFLQEQVLAVTPGIRCIGRPNHDTEDYRRFWQALVRGESKQELRDAFAALIGDAKFETADNAVAALSDETFFNHSNSHMAMAERLRECCPTVDVIVTTRDQRKALPSLYQGHGYQLKGLPEPYNGRHVAFGDWMQNVMSQGMPAFDFGKAYRGYAEVFGAEHVHVMPTELLARDPNLYREKLSAILGVAITVKNDRKINVSHSGRKLRYQQLRDKVLRGKSLTRYVPGGAAIRTGLARYLSGGAPQNPALTVEHGDWIAAAFGESNRNLAKATGDADLAGYPGCQGAN